MSRPIYNRPQDDVANAKTAEQLVTRLNRDEFGRKLKDPAYVTHRWGFQMAGTHSCYDFQLLRDASLHAFVEVKNRRGNFDDHECWHIALHKLEACSAAAAEAKVKFFLIFTWDGKPWFLDMAKAPSTLPCHTSGRYDRGDAADVEPMALLPAKLFTSI